MNFSDGWFPFASDEFPVVSDELQRNVSDHLKRLHTTTCPFLPEYRMALVAFCGNDPSALDLLESAPALILMLVLSSRFNGLNPDASLTDSKSLLSEQRTTILDWLKWPAEPHVARLISKIKPQSLTVNDLLLLRDLCSKPSAMKDFCHLQVILCDTIHIVSAPELRSKVTFSFLEDIPAAQVGWPIAKTLRRTIRLAKRQEKRLPRFKTVEKMVQTYDELILREHPSRWDSLYTGKALPDPFKHFRRHTSAKDIKMDWFRTAEELYRWARQEHNCAFNMIDCILCDTVLMFKVLKPVRGTLALIQKQPGVWEIAQFLSARNKPVPQDALYTVARHLDRCMLGPEEAANDGIPW
jgi:hypothetical protein